MTYKIPTLLAALVVSAPGCFSVDGGGDDGGGGGAVATGECPADGTVGRHVDQVMADLVLQDAEGVEHALHDLCGKVVLVGVGAGWCTACKEEMPDLVDWQAGLADDGFAIYYALNQDAAGNPATRTTVRDWREDYSPNFLVVSDPLDRIRSTYAASLEMPVAMVVDRSMVIRFIGGNTPVPALRQRIVELLAE